MKSQHIATTRFALLGLDVMCQRAEAAIQEDCAKQVQLIQELAATVEKDSAEFYRLTHAGRCLDEQDSPGYCGSCSMATHRAQLKDNPLSWATHSAQLWILLGVAKKLNLGDEQLLKLRGLLRKWRRS